MVVVESMFFDSDDYAVETEVIPCDNKKTAKALVKKIYKKVLENYDFEDEDERKEWEESNVEWKKNGSVHIEGGDCGYAKINIIEKDAISLSDVDTCKVTVGVFY